MGVGERLGERRDSGEMVLYQGEKKSRGEKGMMEGWRGGDRYSVVCGRSVEYTGVF